MGHDDVRRLDQRRRDVDLGDDEHVRVWCQQLGCTTAELREAVRAIGNKNQLVQDFLKLKRGRNSG
jgi:hypothetical protein